MNIKIPHTSRSFAFDYMYYLPDFSLQLLFQYRVNSEDAIADRFIVGIMSYFNPR